MKLSKEREFIHELSGPVCSAIFLADALLADLSKLPASRPEALERLGKLSTALATVRQKIDERKDELVAQGHD